MGPTTRRQRKMAEEKQAADASILSDAPEASHAGGANHDQEPPAATTTASGGNIVVFGDEDDITPTKPVTADGEGSAAVPSVPGRPRDDGEVPVTAKAEGDDEDDSDDEAPEAVSTSKAASDIKRAAAASREAAREQAAAQKRKRQQKNELFKQQAERKKAEEKAAAAAVETQDSEAPVARAGKRQDEETAETAGVTTARKQRADKLPVPARLPAELLTDSSDESGGEEDGEAPREGGSRQKKRKVAAVENRLSRLDRATGKDDDERVGATVYRVLKGRDQRLAPKTSKYAKNSKEALLRRNRSAVRASRGFVRRK